MISVRTDPDEPDCFFPLLAGSPRWDEDGVAIDVGRNIVRVDGPPARLRAILGDCDGRTSMNMIAGRHGEDCRELIATLRADNGVVDGEQAWRVLHSQSSTGAPLGRSIDDATLKLLLETTFAPPDLSDSGVDLEVGSAKTLELATMRRSTTPEDSDPVSFGDLSTILASAYGISPSESGSVPSAGGFYPLIVHVLIREPLPPLETGLWWHDPRNLRLHRLSEVVADDRILFVPGVTHQEILDRRMPVVFLSADLRRPSRKYGPRGYRYALIEAGAALQSAHLAAAEAGVPVRAIGGIEDESVHEYLALPDGAVALLALLVGA